MNFSAVIKLQTPQDTVKAVLGDPTYELHDRWTYQYREACLQLVFRANGGSLKTIVVGYTGDRARDRVSLSWLDRPLGELNLEQAASISVDGLNSIKFSEGLRSSGLVVEERIGPSGAWQYLSFGALCPLYGGLVESEFEWDREASCLKTAPRDILVNWVAISSGSFDSSWFDVGATVPSH